MVKARKLGLIGLIVTTILGMARAGKIEIKNDTTWDGVERKQSVLIRDNDTDLYYFDPPTGSVLISYLIDPNSPEGPILKGKGINSRNTNAVKIWFESRDMPQGIDHFISLRFINSDVQNDYATRNLTLHQDPNNANADPNLYDIKDLTNNGTTSGYINFPTFDPAQFIFRSDNYADLDFNGKVGLEDCAIWADSWLRNDCNSANHWCDFADLDRDGDVDFRDFSRMSSEWLYDTNDPNTW